MKNTRISLGGGAEREETARMKVEHSRWWLVLAPLVVVGCAGKLHDPERFFGPGDCGLDVMNNTCAKNSNCHLNDNAGTASADLQLDYASVGDGHQLIGRVAQGAFCSPEVG